MGSLTNLVIASALCLCAVSAFQKCDPSEPQACAGLNAGCSNGQCACNAGFTGDQFLACHPEGFSRCTVLNDPRGRNFAGEPQLKGVDIPVPCKYKLAHFNTANKPGYDGTPYACSTQIFGAEERNRGKFFESGFEVFIEYTKNPGEQSAESGGYKFLVRASGDNGQLDATLKSRNGLNGGYQSGVNSNHLADAFEDSAVFQEDASTNGVLLDIPACGVTVFLRPADFTIQDISQFVLRPGVSIAVDEVSMNVEYPVVGAGDSFCLSTNTDELNLVNIVEQYGLDSDEAFTFKAFEGNFDQDFPQTEKGRCEEVSDIAAACTNPDRRQSAMEHCFFVLSEPNFITCYLKDNWGTNQLLRLFGRCLDAYCNEDSGECSGAQQTIAQRECSHLANVNFVGFSCNYNPGPKS